MGEDRAGEERVRCYSHTASRKHPEVLGVWGGWASLWPSTLTQIIAFLGSAFVLIKFHHLWDPVVPGILDTFVILGIPPWLWYLARAWQPEGRAPWQFALGLMAYAGRSRSGHVEGVRVRARPVRFGGFFFVRELDAPAL